MNTSESCILIVDDERVTAGLLARYLTRQGFRQVHVITDPTTLPAACARLNPDLIVLDLHMPQMDGFSAMSAIQPYALAQGYLPVLVLTGDEDPDTRHRALLSGAMDFLNKPYNLTEVLARISNLLHTRALHLELARQKDLLEEKVIERTRELEESRLEALERLALAAEFRDDVTGMHTRRVGELAARITLRLGASTEFVELIRRAAPLHDVGKIGVPDSILLKPGRLTDGEMSVMRRHTLIGGEILRGSSSPLLRLAEQIALSHHERWDGSGYPFGIKGEEIPLPGRIVAVADYLDALTHRRPYRGALPRDKVIERIAAESGHSFDPAVVAAILRVDESEFEQIDSQWDTPATVGPRALRIPA